MSVISCYKENPKEDTSPLVVHIRDKELYTHPHSDNFDFKEKGKTLFNKVLTSLGEIKGKDDLTTKTHDSILFGFSGRIFIRQPIDTIEVYKRLNTISQYA